VPTHDIIVVGASAGGVEALKALVEGLPANLPAAVFVVLHIPAQYPSMLPEILSRAGRLAATHAADGAPIRHGQIYVAPPDQHLLVERGHMHVVRGPRENRHRPAVDPLFRTAALAYGPRVVGVILTGALDDGTAGLLAIKQRGGLAVVQDPVEAFYAGMPRSALEHVAVDYCMPLAEIAPLLVRLIGEPTQEEGIYPVSGQMEQEAQLVEMDMAALTAENHPGTPSAFSCPECGEVLWELRDSDLLRFRCRVGHAYNPESVLAGQSDRVEEALWIALKTLEESMSLSRRLARQAHERGQTQLAARFEQKMRDSEQRAALLREVLIKHSPAVTAASGQADQAAS
jgi:two-component system chemotaxis response regulator CheB